MKNNKGYTLVELIVAVAVLIVVMAEVGALMVNSQHLYRNGFYELNMQENAQQVIEQVETLLMNANPWNKADKSIEARESVIERTESTAGGVPSDIITIHTRKRDYDASGNATGTYTNLTYVIGRNVDLHPGESMLGTAGKEYDTLLLQRWLGTSLESEAPMAEGVRSISLAITLDPDGLGGTTAVKTNYLDADLLTLTVVMQNQQYSYTASSETYLRNQPGTGGDPDPGVETSTRGELDLNVLRGHTYDLRELMPLPDTGKTWHFKFKDEEYASMSTKYELDDTTKTIKCTTLNSSTNWGVAVPEATIYAAQWAGDAESWADKKEIKIHTDAVNNNLKLPLYGPVRSDPYVSMYPVNGLCVCDSCVKTRTMTAQITIGNLGGQDVDIEEYWPVHQIVTKHVDLVVFDSGSPSEFNLKHADGSVFNSWDEFSNLTNLDFMQGVIDNAHDSAYIDLEQVRMKLRYYSHNAGASWDHGSMDELNANFTCINNNITFPTESGAFAKKYTMEPIKEGTANAIGLRCPQPITYQGAEAYWDKFVANDGYVRIKMDLTFEHATGTYTFYGYVFPKEYGGDLQTNMWDMIEATEMPPSP